MMDTVLTTDELSRNIRLHHQAAQVSASTAIEHAIEAGKLLAQVKSALPHGDWLPYLAGVEITARQAQRYMQVARHPQLLNTTRVSYLSLRGALAEIAEKPLSKYDAAIRALRVVLEADETEDIEAISYRYDAACFALQQAANEDLDSLSLAEITRRANDTEILEWATEIKVRAERKAGQLLAEKLT